jgi:hypothetical protein
MHICSYIHTLIHAYVHTFICTYVHTYILTYTHKYVHTFICTYICSYVHTQIRAYINSCIRAHIHMYICSYVHTYGLGYHWRERRHYCRGTLTTGTTELSAGDAGVSNTLERKCRKIATLCFSDNWNFPRLKVFEKSESEK